MTKALGMIETLGLIASLEAGDAMVKSADVRLVKKEIIGGGLVTVVVEGDVGAVQAAIEVGVEAASCVAELVASHVIPHPDEGIASIIQTGEVAEKQSPKETPKKPQSKTEKK